MVVCQCLVACLVLLLSAWRLHCNFPSQVLVATDSVVHLLNQNACISCFAPRRTPWVAHDPKRLTIWDAPANHRDKVVELAYTGCVVYDPSGVALNNERRAVNKSNNWASRGRLGPCDGVVPWDWSIWCHLPVWAWCLFFGETEASLEPEVRIVFGKCERDVVGDHPVAHQLVRPSSVALVA